MVREPDRYATVDLGGASLGVADFGGASARPPVLALHGFTGCALDFEGLATSWPGRRVVAVDLPGHGLTGVRGPSDTVGLRQVLLDLADSMKLGRFDVLGYSLGARTALDLALEPAASIRRVVTVGGAPGIEDADERDARRASDEALAERIERDGANAFVAWWATVPIIATQTRAPEPLRERQAARKAALTAEGLALSLRAFGQGYVPSLWDRIASIRQLALLAVGADDEKYGDIALRMSARWPRARRVVVGGAGHAAHLEAPAVFAASVGAWLDDDDEGYA